MTDAIDDAVDQDAGAPGDGTDAGPDGPDRDAPRPVAGAASRVLVVVAVVAVLAGLYADTELAVGAGVVQIAAGDQPTAGVATCAALDIEGEGGAVVTAVADVPPSDDVTTGARIDVLGATTPEVLADDLGPGEVVRAPVDVPDGAAVSARWEGAPLILSRSLTAAEGARVRGGVDGPCPTDTAPRWIVPGVVTAGGASATLHIANPTTGTAAIRVTFTTPEGRIEPTRLGNLVVPAGGRVVVDLNEFAPERPDLGVEVEARSGRVVVEALQQLEAAVGGVDGRSLVAAAIAPAEEWTIPFVDGTEDASSWLWVTNPGETTTEVRIVVHGPDGPFVPPGAGTTLAAGSTQRIDLRGVLAGTAGGVTVRSSEGAPIVVSAAVLRQGAPPATAPAPTPIEPSDGGGDAPDDATTDDTPEEGDGTDGEGSPDDDVAASDDLADRGGIAVVEAVTAAAGRAAVLADVVDARPRTLWLSNPGDDEALVQLHVVRPGGSSAALGPVLSVPAGTSVAVEVPVTAGDAVAVWLEVVAGRLAGALVSATDTGPLELTVSAARRFAGTPVTAIEAVRRDRTVLHPVLTPDGDVDPQDDTGAGTAELPASPTTGAPTPDDATSAGDG